MSVLSLNKIKKRFGPTVALDGVNLQLKQGEVHALIGENGAGKSTLMTILAGAFRPDSGTMELNGDPYFPATTFDARRRGIGLIHQKLSLSPHLSVAENIMMGNEPSRFGWVNRNRLNRSALEVLETFHHPEIRPDRRVADLSVAAQQIVEICRALSARARILLMDEPTSSLQRDDVERLFRVIRKLKSDGGAVVYISHFLEEVREIADTFSVLRDGQSVANGANAAVPDEKLISQMLGWPMPELFPIRSRPTIAVPDPMLEVSDLAASPG